MTARRRRLNKFRLILFILVVAVLFNLISIIKLFYPMPYSDKIFKYAARADIDPYFLTAIMKTESSFDPDAVSPKDARGLMQIMPETGEWIAQQINLYPYHPDLLYDPETNIRLGAWYIANLEDEFAGNRIMVLAAYNGGRGNVRKWLQEDKISGGISDIAVIPFPETRNFVHKVLWNYKVYTWLYDRE
ncbi:soluble lytic murein transglycosylase-like protein [Desulfoscipio gibsoniae DSM 7213]|uniref:Soluble lytic murein transglycosylase-like protein n=1 Tax=Desulfoscipio gibsoniae DSM 7213 TaxID=767817 RepID=R4KHI1_9FIRM|nr:soluble lytic murein transglycosylase-like protein [Desulfoscipio gibsoniae DSM 7213]